MSFDLNKREFRDAIRLPYDWPIPDTQSVCVCGVRFTVDHAMICKRGGFIIQRHNELRDLEAELLKMVCYDVEVEPGLQPVTGEELIGGANQSHDARLDVHAKGFWECQRSAYFDIRVCHPHADSYKDLTLKQLYKQQEIEKKRKYARLCSNGARSPEATNIGLRASEKNYLVARPGTLAYCISSR